MSLIYLEKFKSVGKNNTFLINQSSEALQRSSQGVCAWSN